MKTFLLNVSMLFLAVFCLSACLKEDLSNVDVKVDGSSKTSFRTGSSDFGAVSRTRTGISF